MHPGFDLELTEPRGPSCGFLYSPTFHAISFVSSNTTEASAPIASAIRVIIEYRGSTFPRSMRLSSD